MVMTTERRPRVAVVGLGKIAQKAYLPIVGLRDDIDVVLCTRNREALQRLSRTYRLPETAGSLDELLAMQPDAAFVHSATESHPRIVRHLLEAGAHVYVDKPLAYELASAREMIHLARSTGRHLMVGFNRRFAPLYAREAERAGPRLVVMQKNRVGLADYARRVVYDDFIHVVDTLRFLLPDPPTRVEVDGHVDDKGMLTYVMIVLHSASTSAVGIMNRDSGATEEILEVMAPGRKASIRDLNRCVEQEHGRESFQDFPDWEPILTRRGFPQIIDRFMNAIRSANTSDTELTRAFETHALCEEIIEALEKRGAASWSPVS